MRLALFCLAGLLLAVSSYADSGPEYQMVWHDEFDNDGPPDPANWDFERGFVRNQELQFYQPDNAVCKGAC